MCSFTFKRYRSPTAVPHMAADAGEGHVSASQDVVAERISEQAVGEVRVVRIVMQDTNRRRIVGETSAKSESSESSGTIVTSAREAGIAGFLVTPQHRLIFTLLNIRTFRVRLALHEIEISVATLWRRSIWERIVRVCVLDTGDGWP